jgi:hypothetical protein
MDDIMIQRNTPYSLASTKLDSDNYDYAFTSNHALSVSLTFSL